MDLQPGRSLTHYRLVEPIGEGGMGVVWKADDTKLGRQVAVKILPTEFAKDRQRLARFEREAKILAALNHPNVAAIHGFDHEEDVHYLVLELVPGQTLAEMLKAGPIPVDEALEICRQVAEGLEAAHAAGVIHRDLKPANIKVTPDGKVKVLDFGLAKGLEATVGSGSDLSLSPTVTVGGTQAGVVMGTAPYMSPEQARGKPLDARTDIWSFGCVLYECLTGRLLFRGETVTDILSAILQVDPDWSVLPAKTPPRVRDLLARCLERSPRNRTHHVADARIEIERALAGREWTTSGVLAAEAAASETMRRGASAATWIGLALGLALGAGLMFLASKLTGPSLPEQRVRKFTLPSASSQIDLPQISRDGRSIAYLAGDRVWVRDLDQVEPRELLGSEGTSHFSWSPDGKAFVISQKGALWRLPVTGGQPVRLASLPEPISPSKGGGLAWGDDGRIAWTIGDDGCMAIPEQGGSPVSLVAPGEGEKDFHSIQALPGGRGYVFVVHRDEGIDTLAVVSNGERKDVLHLPGHNLFLPSYAPQGYLLFGSSPDSPGIWAAPFSLDRLELTGDAFPVAPNGGGRFNASEDGTFVHMSAPRSRTTRLVMVDRNGLVTEQLGEPQVEQRRPALSPGGDRVAASAIEGENVDVWIYDMSRKTRMRITFGTEADDQPAWLPGGDRLVYTRHGAGAGDLKLEEVLADGSGTARALVKGEHVAISPDGRFIAFRAPDDQFDRDIWFAELGKEPEPKEMLELDGQLIPRFSPDGRFIVYSSNESGRDEVYISRFPSGEGRWQVSGGGGGDTPVWDAKGGRIYYFQGNDLMEVQVTGGVSPSLQPPRKLFTWPASGRGFDVVPGGQRFVMVQETDPDASGRELVVTESWDAEFKKAE